VLLAFWSLLWKAPSHERLAVVSVAAGALAFLTSSSLSSFSFRWMPCGAIFFLLAALAPKTAQAAAIMNPAAVRRCDHAVFRYGPVTALILICALLCWRSTRVLVSQIYQGRAERQTGALSNAELINYYQAALTADPDNLGARFGLGQLLYRMKRPREAVTELADGVRHGVSNTYGYATLAFACEQAGEAARAREVLSEAVAAYPTSLFIRALYAEALERNGERETADRQRARMRQLNSTDAEVWDNLLRLDHQASIAEARRRALREPAELKPHFGVALIEEREQIYSRTKDEQLSRSIEARAQLPRRAAER